MLKGVWIKSKRSNGSGGNNCVEVMEEINQILVRNSRFPNDGVLDFTKEEWTAFIENVKSGEFDL